MRYLVLLMLLTFGGAYAQAAGETPAIDIGPEWVRETQKIIDDARKAWSTKTRDKFLVSIAKDPTSVTEDKIFNERLLSNLDKVIVLEYLRSSRKLPDKRNNYQLAGTGRL